MTEKETLESILELDSIFLKNHNLMDYSLLLIIEQVFLGDESDSDASSIVKKNESNLSFVE